MLANKKEFFGGVGLMIAFLVVLYKMFQPVFGIGPENPLNYLDGLYNSISKGSAYYIPDLQKKAAKLSGNIITATFPMKEKIWVEDTANLFRQSGATVSVTESKESKEYLVKVSGDLGSILKNCLDDSDLMYKNDGASITAKYGIHGIEGEKLVLYNWWNALKNMSKDLNKQKKFEETKFIGDINKRAVECAYNYYKVTPESISAKWGLVVFSLAFYVVYTMWYGFAILFMFEGWGLKLEH